MSTDRTREAPPFCATALDFDSSGDFNGITLALDGDALTVVMTRRRWDEDAGELVSDRACQATMDLDDWLAVVEALVSELETMRRD